LIVAVLIFFYSQKQDKMDFNLIIENEENLIEIKEQIPELKVFLDDDEITESHKRIKILKLLLRNDG